MYGTPTHSNNPPSTNTGAPRHAPARTRACTLATRPARIRINPTTARAENSFVHQSRDRRRSFILDALFAAALHIQQPSRRRPGRDHRSLDATAIFTTRPPSFSARFLNSASAGVAGSGSEGRLAAGRSQRRARDRLPISSQSSMSRTTLQPLQNRIASRKDLVAFGCPAMHDDDARLAVLFFHDETREIMQSWRRAKAYNRGTSATCGRRSLTENT